MSIFEKRIDQFAAKSLDSTQRSFVISDNTDNAKSTIMMALKAEIKAAIKKQIKTV